MRYKLFIFLLLALSLNAHCFNFVLANKPLVLNTYKINKGDNLKSVLLNWCSLNKPDKCHVVYELNGFELVFNNEYSFKKENLSSALNFLFKGLGNSNLIFKLYKNNVLRVCNKRCK